MQQVFLFGIMQKRNTQERDAGNIQNMDQYDANADKRKRMFYFSLESDDKCRKENHDTNGIASFHNPRNINIFNI